MAPSRPPRIAVVGAGITGITTAYVLLKQSFHVTIYDRCAWAAMDTSYANGGQLSASNAEVWNNWGTVFKGLKWMVSPGAPLLMNPTPSWHKISWLVEFIAAIPRYEQNTITTARLAIEARRRLMRIASEENINFDHAPRGILHFYHTKADFEAAKRVTELLARGGLVRRAVTSDEIRSIEPTLHGSFYGGFYTESDFTGDIHKFSNGVAAACKRLGATMMLSTEIVDIQPHPERVSISSKSYEQKDDTRKADSTDFDQVIICGGVGSRHLARMAGDRINVYPVKGYSITVNLLEERDQTAAPWTGLLDDSAKIVTSRLGPDRFRIAGTAEFCGYNRDIRAIRIDPLTMWCRRHFPEVSTRQVVPWAGLRPMMPDLMPRVTRGRSGRIVYNTGHGHLGWTLSAATAEATAALVKEFASTR